MKFILLNYESKAFDSMTMNYVSYDTDLSVYVENRIELGEFVKKAKAKFWGKIVGGDSFYM